MIYDNLEQAEKRYRTFIEEQLAADRTDEEMKRCNSHMEDFLTQCFRQRHMRLFESKGRNLLTCFIGGILQCQSDKARVDI